MRRPIEHVTAIIRDPSGDILFMRRGGQLQLPGGKVEHGETVGQAVAREMDEELGLPVTAIRWLGQATYRHGAKRYRTTYVEAETVGEPLNRQPELVEELVGVAPAALESAPGEELALSANATRFQRALRNGDVHILQYLVQ